MRSRRYALILSALLFVTALAVLPAAAVPPAGAACGALPWLGEATAPVSPADLGQPSFLWKTSCTTSAQCASGQSCDCGQCHETCSVGFRWNCTCQVCYHKCLKGYVFDESICDCAKIRIRIEQETIHLRAVDHPYFDPVELTTTAARSLAAVLLEMADQLDEVVEH